MGKKVIKSRVVVVKKGKHTLSVCLEIEGEKPQHKEAKKLLSDFDAVYLEVMHPKSYTVYRVTEKRYEQLHGMEWLQYEDQAIESGIVEQLGIPF